MLTIRPVLAGTVPFFQALSRSIDRKSQFFIQSASIAKTSAGIQLYIFQLGGFAKRYQYLPTKTEQPCAVAQFLFVVQLQYFG